MNTELSVIFLELVVLLWANYIPYSTCHYRIVSCSFRQLTSPPIPHPLPSTWYHQSLLTVAWCNVDTLTCPWGLFQILVMKWKHHTNLSSWWSNTKAQYVEAQAWAQGLDFWNLRPGPSSLQALTQAGLSGLRASSPAQPITRCIVQLQPCLTKPAKWY
jgi:hypothetical protein